MSILHGLVALVLALSGMAAPATTPATWLSGHVQNIGWMNASTSGDPQVAEVGTTGRSLRLEALRLNYPAEAAFTMRGHVQNIGWMEPSTTMVGTTGKSLRLEAVQLTPVAPTLWHVWCQAHVQNIGWMAPVKDGATCGTTGRSLRMEAVRIWLEPVPTTEPTSSPTTEPTLSTFNAAGDFGVEQTGLNNLSAIGATGNPLMILGDLGYTVPAKEFCSDVKARVPVVMWVQGNHENRDATGPDRNTAAYQACMPTFPDSSGEVGVQQVYKLPGAWIITASPQEAEPGAYAVGGPRYEWVRAQVRAAKDAGVWPILAMHEPHYTTGAHGSAGVESKNLADLAMSEGVKLVLTGHDHSYSRTVQGGTTFVVAGTGGHNPRGAANIPGWVSCSGGTPGFLSISVTSTTLTGHLVGTCADDFTIGGK